MKEKKTNWIKSRRAGFIGGSVIFLVLLFAVYNIGYGSGSEGQTTTLDEKLVTHEQLVSEIAEKSKELEETETALSQVNEELSNKQQEFNELKEMESNKSELEEQIKEYEARLNQLKEDVAATENQQSPSSSEDNGEDTTSAGTVELGAGHFIIGSDLPPKKYEVVPVGEGGSFIVRDPGGSEVVNVRLGGEGVSSYVFEAQQGYTIVSETPAKYLPVE